MRIQLGAFERREGARTGQGIELPESLMVSRPGGRLPLFISLSLWTKALFLTAPTTIEVVTAVSQWLIELLADLFAQIQSSEIKPTQASRRCISEAARRLSQAALG